VICKEGFSQTGFVVFSLQRLIKRARSCWNKPVLLVVLLFLFFVVVVVGREFIIKAPWGDDEYHRVLGSIPQTRSW
jgi:hypothetical protein